MHAAPLIRLHSVLAATAFLAALATACALHYHKVVKNDVAQYPDEFFPSVSATIGDWFPERNLFQYLIALTAGPRFALVFLQFFLHHSSSPALATLVFLAGLVRTFACGGWVYITSSDNHDVHDAMMILYMLCNIPWMLGGIAATPSTHSSVLRKRELIAAGFFTSLIPLIYFFIQHKVHRVPGAYTRYAFFEWGLVFFDVLYDSVAEQEFKEAGLQISFNVNIPSVVDSNIKPVETLSPSALDKPLADALQTALAPAPTHEATVPPPSALRTVATFLSDVYLAYIFWTLFTALIPTLFYFSVWKLGLAGHELALFSVLSPFLLALAPPYYYIFGSTIAGSQTGQGSLNSHNPRPLLEFARSRYGQTVLHSVALMGLAAYVVPSPGGRLALVATANVIAVLRQAVAWAGLVEGEGGRSAAYQGLVLGLSVMLTSVLKQANRGNNPAWPFINYKADGYNKTALFLALLATGEYYTRPSASPTPVAPSKTKPDAPSPSPSAPNTQHTSTKTTRSSAALAALPFGALLFTIHNLLGDASTLVAWSWTGYADRLPRGPVPHIHSGLTIGAMTVGMAIAAVAVGMGSGSRAGAGLRNPVWWAIGAASAYVMYAYSGWVGYGGGLVQAAFVMSLLPVAFESAERAAAGEGDDEAGEMKVAEVYTAAMGWYCLLNLASIFTVAYAFVPGGVYLRERTDLVLIAQTLSLLPLFVGPLSSASATSSTTKTTKTHTRYILSLLIICPLLSLLTTQHRLRPESDSPKPYRFYLPSTSANGGGAGENETGTPSRILRTGIWAVHFGIDNEGHDSQQGMLRVIRDMELDVVGLLETDLHRTPFGHRDLSRLLVEEGNYYVDIGPGPNKHTWGCVLLSKFPIISTKHHLLPSPAGELAPAIEAVLDVDGTEVLVLVSHNGQEEDALDRELQATVLAEIMAASTRPVIFLGYVVSKPHAERPSPYGIMVSEGNVHDVDAEDLDRWCEYIFYRGLYRTSYARLSRGIITDTETQIAQFVLPEEGVVVNDSYEARYLRVRKEVLPDVHWFPMEYYGNEKEGGVGGHFYHVFNTPLYYNIPENAIVGNLN